MSGKAMSLKAKIRNFAKQKNMSAQVALQNYMFERFLERLSRSAYKDKFILKGGILIATLVGIGNRSTMDLDTTVKNYPLNVESLTKAIKDICDITVEDSVIFNFLDIRNIRDDDAYGGFKVSIVAEYDTIITPMQIDVTTGDAITPEAVFYTFKKIFEEGEIKAWAYNIETVLAEKVETILRRGELNTRPRDFYDAYILTKTINYEPSVFMEALKSTAEHRKTSHIFKNINQRINEIRKSEVLKTRWIKYTKNYNYANDITYEDVIAVIDILIQNL